MPASSPGSRKIPSHLGHSSTTTSRLTLQKCRIMTMPASRGQLRRFSGSNLTAAFCSICSNASPADWSGWSTFRSVHSSNHNPPQPPLQAWIFTSLTATSVIAVPQAGQFIVMTPSRGCSRYPTTLMAPPRAAQPAGRLAGGSRTQSNAGQAERHEVLPRLAGQPVVPHDMVHDPSAVFLHRTGEPRGRVSEPGAELEDLSSVAETCQQVAQVSCRRADDRKPRAPRLGFQLREPRGTRGHELVQVRCHASRQEIHGCASTVSLR